MTQKIRAAIYIRSAAGGVDATSEQRKECREYAEQKGYEITGEYIDTGISGINNVREAFDALTIDAHLRECDRIVVFSPARISRRREEASTFCAELQASCGVIVEFVEGADLL